MLLHGLDAARILNSLDRSLAIIEFDLAGHVLKANDNFCSALGYTSSEIVGQHHRIFVGEEHARSAEYAEFWRRLQEGTYVSQSFKRFAKGGREVWIQASYNPVRTRRGKVYKVIKFASDITAATAASLANAGKIEAISRAQAVIEFTVDGDILTANENFCAALGYRLDEIVGRNHRMFVDPAESQSPAYGEFWAELRRGTFVADEFRRIGKGGSEVFIQASYNPILDDVGRVTRVVKFATDVTARVNAVRMLGDALAALAGGDLVGRIETPFLPTLDPIRASFNSSAQTLQSAMRSVAKNANLISTGADQIRNEADHLARRTEEQAASLEEASAALSEITASVRQSASGAADAGQLVARTKDEAERSGAIVGRAIDAMSEIEASSEKIGRILGVIDEIAFQTNLLALNAGVEAARAGDAGRGFAVVAQEVRALAQRSASAAKEIKALISTSGGHVRTGVELVDATGRALEGIIEKVVDIDAHVARIVASSRDQSIGLGEISTAVDRLDQVTQSTAVTVEQSTAAANELAVEANALATLLRRFQIDAEGTEKPASSPARALNDRLGRAFARTGTN